MPPPRSPLPCPSAVGRSYPGVRDLANPGLTYSCRTNSTTWATPVPPRMALPDQAPAGIDREPGPDIGLAALDGRRVLSPCGKRPRPSTRSTSAMLKQS